jgi:hypothetical protein
VKSPELDVVVSRENWVPRWTAVTVALGITAPPGSETVPRIVPVAWPNTQAGKNGTQHASNSRVHLRIRLLSNFLILLQNPNFGKRLRDGCTGGRAALNDSTLRIRPMQQATSLGDRLIMMHRGSIIHDLQRADLRGLCLIGHEAHQHPHDRDRWTEMASFSSPSA